MSAYRLTSKLEAAAFLTAHFKNVLTEPSILAVREDRCFKESDWLKLGSILLQPGEPEPGEELEDRLCDAVKLGFFEWACETRESACTQLSDLMQLKTDDHKNKAERALDSVACVAARVGLIHPLFDADAIAQMPFRRPTTVVADTSGVLQGGLDFVVRFLYPMARLKVPAISHMEILNSADNYFKYRRATKINNKARALFEHAVSQGGQRALLRLELQTEAEIERGRLGADPLRGVIQSDSDQEDSNLGLQKVQRSFADRLIFETARQHLAQTNPDHPITLLTADQGLARMTLGEGMQPLFFEATAFGAISGRVLSGTTFDPFTGRIYSIGLMDLLWELAVTFGMARLSTADGKSAVVIGAMGESYSWQPYHAKDDLLWVKRIGDNPTTNGNEIAVLAAAKEAPAKKTVPPQQVRTKQVKIAPSRESAKPRSFSGSYKFSVAKLFSLIDRIVSAGSLTEQEAMNLISVNQRSALGDYRNFLMSGGLIERQEMLVSTPTLASIIRSLKAEQLDTAAGEFAKVPSFAGYLAFVGGELAKNPVAERARSTYLALGESLAVCFEIPGERIYATSGRPNVDDFAKAALASYQLLATAPDQYVLTGHWLEELVRSAQIHPVVSRALLEGARGAGLLERFTEGSTPETGYQNHTLTLLELHQGHPTVRRIGIFEGDFLLPGKSSVSIRLKRVPK